MKHTNVLLSSITAACLIVIAITGPVVANPVTPENWETRKTRSLVAPFLENEPETLAAIASAVPAQPPVPFKKPRRVLVLTRGLYGVVHGHGAAGLLHLLRTAAQQYPELEIVEAYTDIGLTAQTLRDFDAVVLNNVGRLDTPASEPFYTEILPAYVEGGGGLFANHSVAHLFMNQPDHAFNRLVGGFTGKGNVHPKRHGQPYDPEILEPQHPLTLPFQTEDRPYELTFIWYDGTQKRTYPVRFTAPGQLADELNIVHPDSDRDGANRVLLQVGPNSADRYPEGSPAISRALLWVKRHGQGRVYYTQFGHNFTVFGVEPIARSMLAGLQYATGDLEAPDLPR